MKMLTKPDLRNIAAQLRRTADELDRHGGEALRRAQDWATPLRSSGSDPGRGKGKVSDPTGTAACSEHADSTAEELTLLSSEAGRCFDAASTLESRLVRITRDAVVDNQRLGVGECGECKRYIDGKDQRLRLGLCEACYRRANRKDKACSHPKQRWSNGVVKCMTCDAVLTEAGTEVAIQ